MGEYESSPALSLGSLDGDMCDFDFMGTPPPPEENLFESDPTMFHGQHSQPVNLNLQAHFSAQEEPETMAQNHNPVPPLSSSQPYISSQTRTQAQQTAIPVAIATAVEPPASSKNKPRRVAHRELKSKLARCRTRCDPLNDMLARRYVASCTGCSKRLLQTDVTICCGKYSCSACFGKDAPRRNAIFDMVRKDLSAFCSMCDYILAHPRSNFSGAQQLASGVTSNLVLDTSLQYNAFQSASVEEMISKTNTEVDLLKYGKVGTLGKELVRHIGGIANELTLAQIGDARKWAEERIDNSRQGRATTTLLHLNVYKVEVAVEYPIVRLLLKHIGNTGVYGASISRLQAQSHVTEMKQTDFLPAQPLHKFLGQFKGFLKRARDEITGPGSDSKAAKEFISKSERAINVVEEYEREAKSAKSIY